MNTVSNKYNPVNKRNGTYSVRVQKRGPMWRYMIINRWSDCVEASLFTFKRQLDAKAAGKIRKDYYQNA